MGKMTTNKTLPKLVFVVPNMASFVRADLAGLQQHYRVVLWHRRWKGGIRVVANWIEQLFLLPFAMRGARAVLISFGGYQSLLPTALGRLLGVRTFIILHGTDCANFPEIGYGNLRFPLLRFCSRLSYGWATRLLPVSHSLMQSVNRYFDPAHPKLIGLHHEFAPTRYPFTVVPNGFDTEFWTPGGAQPKPMSFVTVANEAQFKRKGVDTFLALAAAEPEWSFTIVGTKKQGQEGNVRYTGRMSREELREIYRSSQFYIQLSVFEGYGCALAEALLCGCTAIGSNVNAIPEIIGGKGVVESNEATELAMLAVEIRREQQSPTLISQEERISRLKFIFENEV